MSVTFVVVKPFHFSSSLEYFYIHPFTSQVEGWWVSKIFTLFLETSLCGSRGIVHGSLKNNWQQSFHLQWMMGIAGVSILSLLQGIK